MIPEMTDDIKSYLLVIYYLREDDTGQPTVLQATSRNSGTREIIRSFEK